MVSTTAYSLSVWTTEQGVGSSSAYTVAENTASGAVVTSVVVTPTPTVQSASSVAYEVSLTTSSGGYLEGGTYAGSSWMDVDFGVSTVVPASITAGNVTVDGTVCSDVTISSSGAGGVVRVSVPSGVTISASSSVTIIFNSSSGFTHNTTTGSNTATVATSSDNFATQGSGTYTITASQDLAVTSVTPSPATVNSSASYSVKFTTGSSGAMSIGSTITITFPFNTDIPATISASDIQVNSTACTIDASTTPASYLVTITSPVTVANLTNVTVLIGSAAGILNPTSTGNYTLQVKTSIETNNRTSPSYSFTASSSTVTAAGVSVNTAQQSVLAAYTISFNVGGSGRLIAASSTITVTFPSGTTVGATVSGTPGNTTVSGVAATTVSVSGQAATITVPSGVTIDNDDAVAIVFANAASMITSPTAAAYTLLVKTSVETGDVTSNSYTISTAATAVTVGTVTVVDDTTARTAQYTIVVTPGVTIPTDGTLVIEFPSGTTVPNGTLTSADVTINGSSSNGVSGNSSLRRLTITNPSNWASATAYNVVVTTNIGIVNPSTAATYTLNVWSSEEPTPGTSSSYTLFQTVTSIASLSVASSPTLTSTDIEWTWTFTTSSSGALTSGSGTITLRYPEATTMPASISTAKITVNGIAANSVSTGSGTGIPDSIVVTVGNNIGNSTAVTLIVDVSANVVGTGSEIAAAYYAYTSSDPTYTSKDLALPVELSTFSATASAMGARLTWVTETEIDNLGFHVYRASSPDGPYTRITNYLIPGLGTSAFGQSYEYLDMTAPKDGMVYYKIEDVATYGAKEMHGPVSADMTGAWPNRFELSNAAPNPFNPSTVMRIAIAEPAHVRMVVYNLAGQVIRVLRDQELSTATYSVRWDGRDSAGREVGSGRYIARLVAVNIETGRQIFTQHKGLTLIK